MPAGTYQAFARGDEHITDPTLVVWLEWGVDEESQRYGTDRFPGARQAVEHITEAETDKRMLDVVDVVDDREATLHVMDDHGQVERHPYPYDSHRYADG
jgi:hypothetical protein